jgi:hypothetical protein
MNTQTQEALKMIDAIQIKYSDLIHNEAGFEKAEEFEDDIIAIKEALENLEKDYSFSRNLQEQNILKLAELAGFILTDDKTGIDWASDYDEYLPKFAMLVKATDKDYVLVCEQCAKKLNILE